MKVNKKILKIALIVYVALMVIVIFSSKTIYNLSLPRVTVVSPQSGRLTKGIETFGFTEFADTFTAYAEVYGQIEEMLVQVGDYVKKGDPIARYRPGNPEDEAFILRSLDDGIVISISKENGAFTNLGERVATMGVASNQFYVNISCMPEIGSFIEQGDTADLTITGTGKITATVSQMFLGYDGRLNIRLDFEADMRQSGQYTRVSIQKQTHLYNVLVPNEAIFREGMNNYVWTVQSRQGALGAEYFTVKVRVIIADSDDFYTAIARGLDTVVPAVPVVLNKDKDLTVNGRVRRME